MEETKSTEDLIREGATLDKEIKKAKRRLKEVNALVAEAAEFKGGAMTGHTVGAGHKVTVLKKENVKWDQGRLREIAALLPERFCEVFEIFKAVLLITM